MMPNFEANRLAVLMLNFAKIVSHPDFRNPQKNEFQIRCRIYAFACVLNDLHFLDEGYIDCKNALELYGILKSVMENDTYNNDNFPRHSFLQQVYLILKKHAGPHYEEYCRLKDEGYYISRVFYLIKAYKHIKFFNDDFHAGDDHVEALQVKTDNPNQSTLSTMLHFYKDFAKKTNQLALLDPLDELYKEAKHKGLLKD
jgi:hypothetical protein